MSTTKTYSDLRSLNVSEYIEKKGGLSYLSWTWAVDQLMQQDPLATWVFDEPQYFGQTVMVQTVMVFCSVHALGKIIKMHLPVMDNRNQAVMNPDARKISDAMMRCLTKAIACFGIGLYIYAGEDVPEGEESKDHGQDAKTKTAAIQTLKGFPARIQPKTLTNGN